VPNVIVRQSRNRGSGIIIAVIMLTLIAAFRYGPGLGRLQDVQTREQREQQQLYKMMEHHSQDMESLRKAFKKDDAADRLLEQLPKSIPASNDQPQ
jgi:Tfp pilus assembly protein PilN